MQIRDIDIRIAFLSSLGISAAHLCVADKRAMAGVDQAVSKSAIESCRTNVMTRDFVSVQRTVGNYPSASSAVTSDALSSAEVYCEPKASPDN
jgi:hypothetical protein